MNKYTIHVWIIALSVTILACVDSKRDIADDDSQTKNSAESKVAIKSGFYGMAYSGKNKSYELEDVYPDFPVIIKGKHGEDTIHSDKSGFYQVELPKGEYTVCSSEARCIEWTLDTIQQRCDYENMSAIGWNCYAPSINLMPNRDTIKVQHNFVNQLEAKRSSK